MWVGEYSRSQDCFHVQPVEKALSTNLRRMLARDSSDWIIFIIGDEFLVRRMVVEVEKAMLLARIRVPREAN
jgi:hypothetical protein